MLSGAVVPLLPPAEDEALSQLSRAPADADEGAPRGRNSIAETLRRGLPSGLGEAGRDEAPLLAASAAARPEDAKALPPLALPPLPKLGLVESALLLVPLAAPLLFHGDSACRAPAQAARAHGAVRALLARGLPLPMAPYGCGAASAAGAGLAGSVGQAPSPLLPSPPVRGLSASLPSAASQPPVSAGLGSGLPLALPGTAPVGVRGAAPHGRATCGCNGAAELDEERTLAGRRCGDPSAP
jgi:hypothetical protein